MKTSRFYDDAKTNKLNPYKTTIEGAREVLIPDFAKIRNHTLYLSELRLGDGQVQALRDYMCNVSNSSDSFKVEEGKS